MSQTRFFKGLSLLIILNILIKPVWIFFIDRQVQNLSGHENYGSYFSIFSLSIVLGFVADAGISNMMNRQVALSLPARINQLFRYKLILSFLFVLIFLLVCYLSGIRQWELVLLVAWIQVMNSFVIFFRSVITASQKFSTDSWISILDKLLVCIFLLPMFYLVVEPGEQNLYLFLYVQAGSLLITMCIAAYQAGKCIQEEEKTTVSFTEVLKLTLPFVILIGLMGLHNRLDMFLLERLHSNGAYEAGVYAASYRLLDAGNMVGYLSASFLVPFAARHLHTPGFISPVVVRLRQALLNFSMTAAAFCFLFSGWVIGLLYHISDDYYNRILQLCLLSLPAYMMIHVYGSLLTASGRFRSFTWMVITSVAINLCINLLFIREYGALSCVYTALISQYLLAALCYVKAVHYLKLRFYRKAFLLNLLYAAIMIATLYFLREAGVKMYLIVPAAGVVTALIMFVQTKMIRIFD